MIQFFRHLFGTDFMPHGHCYFWNPGVLWTHVLSDAVIALSYLSIPISLIYFIRRRRDIVFERMFVMFGAFIFLCGATHALEIWTVWTPSYRLAGAVKALAGVVSASTAIALWRLMPRLMSLPSPAQLRDANRRLQDEIGVRERAQEELQQSRDDLERRVQERTADLARANDELRASQLSLRAIVDNSPTMMDIVDAQGRYVLVNRRFEKLLGVPAAAALGQTPDDLFPPPIAAALSAGVRESFQRGAVLETEQLFTFEGEPRVYLCLKFPLLDLEGKPYGVCGSARDVTKRKQANEELRRARDEAERASNAKTEFLSRTSHELRTPLNAILGFAQLLEMEDPLPSQRPCIEQILRAGRHLLGLVNEVLDLSHVESGKLGLVTGPVAACEVLQQCVELMRPAAAARSIEVTLDGSCAAETSVQADAQRLRQVLLNLLSNAVKYNQPGGRITVSCSSVDGQVRLAVHDTGPGIAEADRERIFEPFERVQLGQVEADGAGLGLAVAKKLVGAMGGRIDFQSAVGRGSTFWVDLPRGEAPMPPAHPPAATAAPRVLPPRGRTVLYIEDNRSNLDLLQRIFDHRTNMRLITAIQGRLGLELALEKRPDVILLDLHLPDMHGSEVLARLKDDPLTARTPVIVVSADAMPSEIERLLAAGARAYLTKPYDLAELLSMLNNLLETAAQASSQGAPQHAG